MKLLRRLGMDWYDVALIVLLIAAFVWLIRSLPWEKFA